MGAGVPYRRLVWEPEPVDPNPKSRQEPGSVSCLKRVPSVPVEDSQCSLSSLGETKTTFTALKDSAGNMGLATINAARKCFDLVMFWCVGLPLYIVVALLSTGEVTWENAMSQVPKTMTPQYVRSQVCSIILPGLREKYVAAKEKAQGDAQAKMRVPKERFEQARSAIVPRVAEKYEAAKQQAHVSFDQAKLRVPGERLEQADNLQQRAMTKYADLKRQLQKYYTRSTMMPEQLRSLVKKIQPCLMQKYAALKEKGCAARTMPKQLQTSVMENYAALKQSVEKYYAQAKAMPKKCAAVKQHVQECCSCATAKAVMQKQFRSLVQKILPPLANKCVAIKQWVQSSYAQVKTRVPKQLNSAVDFVEVKAIDAYTSATGKLAQIESLRTIMAYLEAVVSDESFVKRE